MATTPSKLTFHFPVAASPDKILILLRVLAEADEPILKSEDLDRLSFDLSSHNNRFTEARILTQHILDLIDETEDGLQVTKRAQAILSKRDSVQYDVLHYIFLTAWQPKGPAQYQARSWLYRTLCNQLWSTSQVTLDRQTRLELTQQINRQAEEDFVAVASFSTEGLSLGIQTLDGALKWLSHLKPAVLEERPSSAHHEGELFSRRAACSGELFLLALSHSYQLSDSEAGTDMLLSSQRRDEISRLCMLDPLHFDRMLDWAIPMFPQFLAQGTRAGSYGRFVRLHRFVTLEDLA